MFFKWIKQHLHIKKFYGNSENAVKSQRCGDLAQYVCGDLAQYVWITVSVYGIKAIVKKRLNLDASLYTLLEIFSLTLFEKMPIQQTFPASDYKIRTGGRLQPDEFIRVLTG